MLTPWKKSYIQPRQNITKQRHYFVNKGPSSQCYGFSSNHVWMFKLDLKKAEEPEIQLPTSIGLSKKQESSRETSISALLTTPKPLTVWITTDCGKFLKRWEYQTTLPASWEIYMQVKKQQLELNTEQQTGSKLGKEYAKAECQRIDAFELWCLEKTLESPLDWKEIKPVHPKGNQSRIFIGRTEAETPKLWPPKWEDTTLDLS